MKAEVVTEGVDAAELFAANLAWVKLSSGMGELLSGQVMRLSEAFPTHSSHSNGFSPVYVLLYVNVAPQPLQTNGFSPVWVQR